MRNLSQVILISVLLAMPAYAAADEIPVTDDQAKIERLELEVKQLTDELQRMRMQYDVLQTQLDNVRHIIGRRTDITFKDGEDVDTQLCLTRLVELNKLRTKLENLGYKDQHPDMVNVLRQVESLKLECGQSDGKPSGN